MKGLNVFVTSSESKIITITKWRNILKSVLYFNNNKAKSTISVSVCRLVKIACFGNFQCTPYTDSTKYYERVGKHVQSCPPLGQHCRGWDDVKPEGPSLRKLIKRSDSLLVSEKTLKVSGTLCLSSNRFEFDSGNCWLRCCINLFMNTRVGSSLCGYIFMNELNPHSMVSFFSVFPKV